MTAERRERIIPDGTEATERNKWDGVERDRRSKEEPAGCGLWELAWKWQAAQGHQPVSHR